MDLTVMIGLVVVIAGLAVVRFTLFGHVASLDPESSPLGVTTVPASTDRATSPDVVVRRTATSDVKVAGGTRVRSGLLLVLVAVGAGAAIATVVGVALIIVGISLWG